MKTLKLKDFPTLKAQVRRWAPGYRKQSVMVCVGTTEKPFGWWWDEGSKSDFATARIGGAGTTPWNCPAYPNTNADPIPVGGETVAVESGIFQGKPATLKLTIHPDDLDKLGLTIDDTKR